MLEIETSHVIIYHVKFILLVGIDSNLGRHIVPARIKIKTFEQKSMLTRSSISLVGIIIIKADITMMLTSSHVILFKSIINRLFGPIQIFD